MNPATLIRFQATVNISGEWYLNQRFCMGTTDTSTNIYSSNNMLGTCKHCGSSCGVRFDVLLQKLRFVFHVKKLFKSGKCWDWAFNMGSKWENDDRLTSCRTRNFRRSYLTLEAKRLHCILFRRHITYTVAYVRQLSNCNHIKWCCYYCTCIYTRCCKFNKHQ